jgi:hypothetical protein
VTRCGSGKPDQTAGSTAEFRQSPPRPVWWHTENYLSIASGAPNLILLSCFSTPFATCIFAPSHLLSKLQVLPPLSSPDRASPRRLLPAIRPTTRLAHCAQRAFRNRPPLPRGLEHLSHTASNTSPNCGRLPTQYRQDDENMVHGTSWCFWAYAAPQAIRHRLLTAIQKKKQAEDDAAAAATSKKKKVTPAQLRAQKGTSPIHFSHVHAHTNNAIQILKSSLSVRR